MIRKLLLLFAIIISMVFGLNAQSSGTLKGQVFDDSTGEELFGADVVLKQKGSIITGASTGLDGSYSINLIPAGYYEVEVSNLGFQKQIMQNVYIPGGKITIQNFKIKQDIEVLGVVDVIDYAKPLINPDQTSSGDSFGSKDLAKMPGRDASSVATTVAGVYSEDGGVGSIRGSRGDATVYYVDGIKVRSTQSIPKSAIEQVTVITGGLPAQYGDVTGGVISTTSKGPSSEFFGGVELETSQFLDPFGHNLAALTLSGPIIKKKTKDGRSERSIVGFLVSVEGTLEADISHSTTGVWRAKDDVIENIKQNPTRVENGVIYNNIEFLKADAFKLHKSTKNTGYRNLNVVGKIDISPVRDLNITFGGTLYLVNQKVVGSQMFNYDQSGIYKANNWRVYARLAQRFRTKEEEENNKTSIIKDPLYQIQADYESTGTRQYNPDFSDNLFRYGHLGYYDVMQGKHYLSEKDEATGITGTVMDAFTYAVDPKNFRPSEYNPLLSRYVQQYYEFFPERLIDPNSPYTSYYMNGNIPSPIYGANGPGTPVTSYNYSNSSQFRVVASGAAEIKKHEISLGFEYEQRSNSNYSIATVGLWNLARQYTNTHIMQKDSMPTIIRDESGSFLDTIEYGRAYNPSAQSQFDINLRNHLGLAVDGKQWINIDNMNPDDLDYTWFSADEMFNNGSSIVSYYGYDYTGKKLNYKPTLNDFFTKNHKIKLPDGTEKIVYDRPIGSFEPNYIAGYIQDKFAFKDLIFNIGIRIDRYDANQMVLKDMYTTSSAYTIQDIKDNESLISGFDQNSIEKIRNLYNSEPDAVLYVDNKLKPTKITGYRVGDVWYTTEGKQVENVNNSSIAGSNGVTPLLKEKVRDLSEPDMGAFEDYKPQINVLPRIAFSFPISEDALFFAHYDILAKRPGANQLYPVYYLYLQQYNQDVISNPNLKCEKTTDYELGFQQKLTNSSSLKLSAFYREMRDMLQTISVKGAYPTDYYTYGNIDFGTVKGLSAIFDLRRTGNVTLRASYTLQFANGTGSDAGSQEAIVKSNKPNLKTTLPLNYDQRHNIQISFDYRFGGKATGEPYNGPKISGKHILANTGVNLLLKTGSGSPYTVYSKPSGGTVVGSMNGARKPWRAVIDMRIDRDIRIKLAKAKKNENGATTKKDKYGNLNIYLEISNLLNTKNILDVYSYTGSAVDSGYLDFDENQQIISVMTDEESYRNYYIMSSRYNDSNYSSPRTIKLGLAFNF